MLSVLCSPHPGDERRLEALAQFLGLPVRPLSGPPNEETGREVAAHLAATCESLEAFQRQPAGRAWLSKRLADKGSTLFLTGIEATTDCVQTIAHLIPGIVESVRPVRNHETAYDIARVPSSGMPQFAGLTFGSVDREADAVFALQPGAGGVTELIAIEGQPCYIRVERGSAIHFLVACSRVLDIDAPAEHVQLIERFLRFVPFLAYLRLTFGTRCWHNEAPAACFIVDDPLLRRRYGFLDFADIESHMAGSRFSMNIAFIPWNCRRSDLRVAEKFKRTDRRFSISIHGCDHTEGEFGVTDEKWLRSQSRRALSRMDVHQELTGIRHNRVMVFPQGVFSKASLKALAEERFVAAVNSTIYAVDAEPNEVTFRDLMEMAMVRFGGTPLFLRQYAERREKIALDLFLGRPVLLVEHHGFFKRGYGDVQRCTAFINEIAPDITWTDLEELCSSAYVVRESPSEDLYVRAFGSVLRLKNRRDQRSRFMVSNVGVPTDLASVTWNGRAIDFAEHVSGVRCEVVLDSGEQGVLCFHRPADGVHREAVTPPARDRFKAFSRRLLCEIRDNYLDRSATLSEFARRGKSFLARM